MKQLSTALALAALFASVQANAVTLTLDADDYVPATVIGPTPDIAVSYVNHNNGDNFLSYTAALAVTEPSCTTYAVCKAPTGTVVMSNGTLVGGVLQPSSTGEMINMYVRMLPDGSGNPIQLTPARLASMQAFRAIRLDFTNPTDFVSVDFYGATDSIRAFAFDSTGTLLGVTESTSGSTRTLGPGCSGPGCSTWVQTKNVTSATANISFIILGSSSSATYPDAVRFNP